MWKSGSEEGFLKSWAILSLLILLFWFCFEYLSQCLDSESVAELFLKNKVIFASEDGFFFWVSLIGFWFEINHPNSKQTDSTTRDHSNQTKDWVVLDLIEQDQSKQDWAAEHTTLVHGHDVNVIKDLHHLVQNHQVHDSTEQTQEEEEDRECHVVHELTALSDLPYKFEKYQIKSNQTPCVYALNGQEEPHIWLKSLCSGWDTRKDVSWVVLNDLDQLALASLLHSVYAVTADVGVHTVACQLGFHLDFWLGNLKGVVNLSVDLIELDVEPLVDQGSSQGQTSVEEVDGEAGWSEHEMDNLILCVGDLFEGRDTHDDETANDDAE